MVSAVNENEVTNGAGLKISSLMPYNTEEANEWIFVHVKHASSERVHIMIKAVDSISYKIVGPDKSLDFLFFHHLVAAT